MNGANLPMREERSPLSGLVRYHETNGAGHAFWRNISRVGGCLELGRYLRPGRVIRLTFASPVRPDETVEIKARVMWCEPLAGRTDFLAGVQIYRDAPESVVAFAGLAYEARRLARRRQSAGALNETMTYARVGQQWAAGMTAGAMLMAQGA